MNLLYKFVGITSLILGIIGAFLPLLPTTCFVLLSAWCFSKSSPKWYSMLHNNAFFGKILTQWEQHRTIPEHARRIAIGSIILSVTYTSFMVSSINITLFLIAIALVSIFSINQFREVG